MLNQDLMKQLKEKQRELKAEEERRQKEEEQRKREERRQREKISHLKNCYQKAI